MHSPATGTVSCSFPAGPAQKHREIRAPGRLSSRAGLEKTTFPRNHRGTGPIATPAVRLRVLRPQEALVLISRKLHFPEVTAAADQSQRALCACAKEGSLWAGGAQGPRRRPTLTPPSPGVLGQVGESQPLGNPPPSASLLVCLFGGHTGAVVWGDSWQSSGTLWDAEVRTWACRLQGKRPPVVLSLRPHFLNCVFNYTHFSVMKFSELQGP